MRRLLVSVALAVLAVLIALLKGPAEPASPRSAVPAPEPVLPLPPRSELRIPTSNVLSRPVLPAPLPVTLAAIEEPPMDAALVPQPGEQGRGEVLPPGTALENMRSTIRQYALRFGENPVGDNSEITAALSGKNQKRIFFLNPEDGLQVNSKGQLVDSWGTPYFFHQVSRNQMEVHSAGPDRRLWTADDLVVK